jgi:photosystem II stability/assembly factor-like uncharacterized protein
MCNKMTIKWISVLTKIKSRRWIMKKALLISILLVLVSLAFGWDLLRQAQFPTNFYALDRAGTTLWAAGYVGGFAKSTDNGETWTFLPNPAYDAVTPAYKDINDIDFYDELHGVMVSIDGLVAITADGGATWNTPAQTQTTFGTNDVNACVYLPDGKIWVAGWNGIIMYSPDNGATWSTQTSGLTDQIYSISMNSSGIGFCAMNRGTPNQSKILTTTNFGSTWDIQNLTITSNPHLYKVRQYADTVVLAGSLGYIGVSYDNGANWTHHVNAGGATVNMQDIVLNGNIGYAVGWNGVLLGTANAWTSFDSIVNDFGLYFEGINILINGNLVAAGWNGAIAKSTDQGVSWTDKVANAIDLFSAGAIDADTWYLAGDKGYIIKTTDSGLTFNRLHIPNNFDTYYACHFKNANEGWVSGKTTGKIFNTIDGGNTWTTFTVPGVTSTQIYYEFFFVSDLVGYVVGSSNISAKTVDGGLTWTMLNGTGLGSSILYNVYFRTENIGFAGSGSGQLFITQNGGQSWAPIVVGSNTAQIRDVWFKDDNIGVLVNSVGEIFHTSNGGLAATDWVAGTESCLDDINGVWCDANNIYWAAGYSSDNTSTNIGNSWAIVKSVDFGATWTQETFPALTFNSTRFMGMTGVTGKLVAYGRNNLIVAANNGGIEPPTFATNLFFSEYVEGSSNNKALEIFNGTGQPVDLTQYSVKLGSNGNQWSTSLTLAGTLANNDVYIIANASASAAILALADVTSTVTYYNGNDALGLFQGTNLIDMLGVVGTNPGVAWPVAGVANAMLDHTLIRKPTVISPTTDWTASAGTNLDDSQWLVHPIDYIADLGVHTFTPAAGNACATPTFDPPGGIYTSPISVTLASATPGATIYYTLDGTTPTNASPIYSNPIPVSAATTIKAFATAAGMSDSFVATAVYTYPVIASNLAALRALPADNTTIYIVSGEVILTFKQIFRNQKYIQDASAAVLIDDLSGIITTVYNVGDGITGLTGKLSEFGGMLQFVPTANPPAATSTGNVINPQVITLNDLVTGFEAYESELVKIMNCSFVNPAGIFANGTVYPINDTTADYGFRTSFYDVDYIGQSVPTTPMDIVGIPNSRADGSYLTSRSSADIQTPQGEVPSPTFTPNPGMYYDPIQVTISAVTGAVIHYTTNGTVPTEASPVYTDPININTTTTVKAIAVLNTQSSAVATAVYSFPVEVASLAALRQQTIGTTVYKVTGEVILTFKQAYRNQKWLQDNTAGVMIDDFNGIVTTVYNVGDGITGLTGTLIEYGGMLEFIPTQNPAAATSTSNAVVPQNVTMAQFISSFESFESELIMFEGATFNTPETVFANGTVYPITDGTDTINFRTSFYDVDYIGTTIPTTAMNLIGIANSRTDGIYFTARSLADFAQGTFGPPELLSVVGILDNNVILTWAPGPVPVQNGNLRDWENLTALRVYRNNLLIATITDFVIEEMAFYDDINVPGGEYDYYVTNVYFNQFESGPSNTVHVTITANDEEIIIPAEITALNGNYPNPFNPQTTIRYSVKNPSLVNITVYNLKGEKVRTLVSESKANGFYSTVWNGKDDSGNTASSGVYLYRMMADGMVSTQRMLLVK